MKLTWAAGRPVDITFTPADSGAARAGTSAAPVLVIWPAFGAPAPFYRHLTPALAAAGMASLVVEYPDRDTPTGAGRHSTYGYDALATGVHQAVMTWVRRECPGSPVFLLGHSLGGQVSLLAAAVHTSDDDRAAGCAPDGVILAASASPYWRGFGPAGFVRTFFGTAAMALVARGVGYWPGDRLRFWGRQSRVLVADWARFARAGRVRPAGAQRDYGAALADYDGEVLAISLPEDTLAPVSALERLLALVPRASITRWHAPTRLGHVQWVRRNETVVPIIAEWVFARI